MSEILIRAGCFVAIILLGAFTRRVGMLSRQDFVPLSKIVIRVTLTAAIVTSFTGRVIQPEMFLLSLMGTGFGVVLMLVIFGIYLGKSNPEKAFAVLNIAGCNIGNFVLPFARSFLGPVGVMCVSLFDAGNSLICLGGAYGVACSVKEGGKGLDVRPILKAMSRSVPLITYIIMTVLCLLHISLPGPVIEFAEIIANANAFLAMFMIGVGFRLSGDRSQLGSILKILGTRFALGLGLALVSFFLLPFPLEYRQALVIVFLSPIASAAPGFTAEMKGDFGLSSAVNSISIVVSIVLITTALVLVL